MKLTRNLRVSMRELLYTGETNEGSGDILFFPLRLSVIKSCPLYNLITV